MCADSQPSVYGARAVMFFEKLLHMAAPIDRWTQGAHAKLRFTSSIYYYLIIAMRRTEGGVDASTVGLLRTVVAGMG